MRKQIDHMLKLMGIRRPTRGAKANGDPCARYETLLSAYTDGVLDERKTALVEGHLNACAACRASLAATRLMSGTLAHKPCPMFTGEMSARLRLALAAERERVPKHLPIFTGPRIAAVGAAACTVVAIGLLMGHGKHDLAPIANSRNPGNNSTANQVATNFQQPRAAAVKSEGGSPYPVEPTSAANQEFDENSADRTAQPPAPIVPHTFSGTPKPAQTIEFNPQILNQTRPKTSAPDAPDLAAPTQPAPAPSTVAKNDAPVAPAVSIVVTPPAPQPAQVAYVAPAPPQAEIPIKPARLMLASSVHLAGRDGGGSNRVELTRDLQVADGTGTVSMVASDFH